MTSVRVGEREGERERVGGDRVMGHVKKFREKEDRIVSILWW